ncbi:hypothetical protein SAMN05216276_1014158 [Streptosporangium subroseum]|uniref:Uncharacterized protein n=1 Tax=Streptosporangium subroseum TaxID=106412 RepID=A0A239GWI1_9ACTN|nr:hypothetical protein SAMN05216276_1014158 [Streptosporangium subroseum]
MILTGAWAVHSGRIRSEAVRTRNAGKKAFGTHGWTAGRARSWIGPGRPGAMDHDDRARCGAMEPVRSDIRKIVYLI